MLEPSFWGSKTAQATASELNVLKGKIGKMPLYNAMAIDLLELAEIADESMVAQLADEAESLGRILTELEQELLSGPDDHRNAFLTIKPGGGGIEACDWALMMMRMYVKWCDIKGFKTELMDIAEKDIGIASVTLKVIGPRAYGLLKGDHGCHKMARFSPYGKGAGQIRQTSFASVEVEPEADEVGEIEIEEKDVLINFCCSGGPGGQAVNKKSTCCMLLHHPTGIRIRASSESGQLDNKKMAFSILKAKLKKRMEEEANAARSSKTKVTAGFGSEYVRVYCIEPEPRVTDQRTGVKTTHVQDVLNGGLDVFLTA